MNKKEVAQKIVDAFYSTFADERVDFTVQKLNNNAIANVLREVVNLSNEWIEIGGDSWDVRNVVYVTDILDVCDELEAL